MFSAEKRIKKFSGLNNKHSDSDQGIESDFNSQVDFTNSTADFSLPPAKRKSLASRQVSNKQSFNSTDQASLGYSSLHSSSSLSSPRKSHNRTPKKRKHEESESDENAFYNSYQFVSPLKFPRLDPDRKNCAKLILKEKSSSENVILSSTPIRNNNKATRWGKFSSHHPEKYEDGKALVGAATFTKLSFLPKSTEASFEGGDSFDFTTSFDLTNQDNIPADLEQLCTGSIIDSAAKPEQTSTSSNLSTSSRTRFHCGRLKLNIMGKLHMEQNLALNMILSRLDDADLLSLSHVSKDYRNMIKSNKTCESKRQNYLKKHRATQENKGQAAPPKARTAKRAFGETSVNHMMQLRPKTMSPPVSPSRKRFVENQKVVSAHSGTLKKCPRCGRPSVVNCIKIRSSPRKAKKLNILKISSGRVQKRNKSFLAKPSIDSIGTASQLFVTFPTLDDRSGSTSPSSNYGSPSSDESSSSEQLDAEMYEFGVCSGQTCNYKFCVKCNCKYHPRAPCKDFSPASPTRGYMHNSSTVACTSQSIKSLKRLIY